MEDKGKNAKKKISKALRVIHRDLSYLFAGVIIIYALSGITMNHFKGFNAKYSIEQKNLNIRGDYPRTSASYSKEELLTILDAIHEKENYTKHFTPDEKTAKIFMKEGSSLTINTQNGKAKYESIKRRPIVSSFATLHYNPNKWWTVFSDIFAVSLVIITITGILLIKGKKGIFGTGGVKLLIGIIIPILFLLST